jgi:hypothetical protein
MFSNQPSASTPNGSAAGFRSAFAGMNWSLPGLSSLATKMLPPSPAGALLATAPGTLNHNSVPNASTSTAAAEESDDELEQVVTTAHSGLPPRNSAASGDLNPAAPSAALPPFIRRSNSPAFPMSSAVANPVPVRRDSPTVPSLTVPMGVSGGSGPGSGHTTPKQVRLPRYYSIYVFACFLSIAVLDFV